jgi:phosphoenolpyruvate synthase/pyruvate phosphate dikinase
MSLERVEKYLKLVKFRKAMLIKEFSKISKNDADIAGGKGASLGEMTQAGLPVPPGFVLLAGAFDIFLAETDLNVEIEAVFNNINRHDIASVEHAAEKIQALILGARMPENIKKEIEISFANLGAEFVAVRSSATAEDSSDASWAGELESYLNTTEDALIEAVKKCWASLFTPRAIFYRFEKEMHNDHVSVAVVIQKMVQSEVSGITFTVHPVTEDYNQMVIEAGYGLGEAIVGGMITPDTYVINKLKVGSDQPRVDEQSSLRVEAGKSKAIEDKNVSKQEMMIVRSMDGNEEKTVGAATQELQKISDEQIIELSKICIDIEKHYGFPCDIEWAYEGAKFYIVQSRPITTLNLKAAPVSFDDNGAVKIPGDEPEKLARTLEDIKKYSFEKHISYQFIPVICFESSCKCYVDNPYLEKLGAKNHPNFISILDKSYEAWGDWSQRVMIKDKKDAEHIIDESHLVIRKYQNRVKEINSTNFEKLSSFEVLDILKKLDEIATDVYHLYIFYIDECFEIADEKLNQQLPDVRMELSDFVSAIYVGCDKVIERLSGLFPDLSWKTFTYSTVAEIEQLINDSEKDLTKFAQLLDRRIAFITLDNKLQSLTGTDVTEIKKYLANQNSKINDSVVDIMGVVARRGSKQGEVIKILESDYGNVGKKIAGKKNYVLVIPMTRPEIVPMIKNAVAIVTDEGGITCHAAIVSRELDIPCIVGTKIATKVLKDGDLVEVDAYNGIVRILNNYNIGHYRDYQRLFQWKGGGLPYLISDIFMDHYKTLDGLVILKDGIWTNFLPKKKIQETLNDGLERLSSIEKFEKYKNDFESYQKECVKFLDIVISKQDITRQELDTALEFFVKLFFYYSKTEFFYIDKAFEQSGDNEIVKRNLDSFDEIKNGGRTFLNKLFLGGDSYIEKILVILVDKFSVEVDDLKFYSMEELSFLFDNKKLEEDILSKRKTAFILRTSENKVESSFGDVAADIIENFLHEAVPENSEELSGTVANKGKVNGKVFIIDADYKNFHKISEAIDKMNQGDILVADTTAPEIMIACKKASAILTNQGGLMSHAAIVSRELGIPCMVGLGNITDVVNNGDLVEVDADNGIVRIFGKRNE